jgi:hypothetical protein
LGRVPEWGVGVMTQCLVRSKIDLLIEVLGSCVRRRTIGHRTPDTRGDGCVKSRITKTMQHRLRKDGLIDGLSRSVLCIRRTRKRCHLLFAPSMIACALLYRSGPEYRKYPLPCLWWPALSLPAGIGGPGQSSTLSPNVSMYNHNYIVCGMAA